MMNQLFQWVASLSHFSVWGYILVLLLAFFESFAFIGILIPGSILLIITGFLAAHGVVDIGDLFVYVVIGAILGDSFSFFLGQKGTIMFKPENRVFKSSLLEKGEQYFRKYGAKSVFFGRFIGWVRPIVPFVAGVFRLNWKLFLFWNILSGLLWAASYIAIGYFFGQSWLLIVMWLTRVGIFMTGIILILILFYILKWLGIKKGKQLFIFLVSLWRSVKSALFENQDVQRLKKRHHKLFLWIHRRFDRYTFLGLPTTLLFISFIYVIVLLSGVIEAVITSDLIVATDIRIANLLSIFRTAHITTVFLWITLLGKWQIVLLFFVTASLLLWIWRKRVYIAPFFITIIGSEVFTYLGKFIIHRPRPDVALYTEHTFSFPSGHATIAVAFYGFITYILVRHVLIWKKKVNFFFAGFFIILLIGFSRLYLGVHYVSDIWGGYLIGALWLVIGISISEWLYHRRHTVSMSKVVSSRIKPITVFIIIASILLYGGFALNYNPVPKQVLGNVEVITIQNVEEIFTEEQLKYSETITGSRQEPLNFIILAKNNEQLIRLFKKADWQLADSITTTSVLRFANAAVFKKQYLQAPMTPSFWNTKPHDFGFEKSTEENRVRQRHHARFWKTNYTTKNGLKIYVGTASLDIGLKWGGIAHIIDSAIDKEREFLFDDLNQTGLVKLYKKQKLTPPILGKNFSGDSFFTDGLYYSIVLQ